MSATPTILEGYSGEERGAYLCAIASLATADRQASEEELEYLDELSRSANLNAEQQDLVRQAATSLTGEDLQQCLDLLKGSELRFSLVADLMAFAKADGDYSEGEEQSIQKISDYLGISSDQQSALNEFSRQKVQEGTPNAQQQFLGGGLGEKLQGAGINAGSLMKGVLAFAAPMILGRMMGRRSMGGMLGRGMMGGGLSSLIGMLSGGRGLRSTGGLLGRLMGRRRF